MRPPRLPIVQSHWRPKTHCLQASTCCWLLSDLPMPAPTLSLSCRAPQGVHGSLAVLHLCLFPARPKRSSCAAWGKLRQGEEAADGSRGWWVWIGTDSRGRPRVLLPFPPGATTLTHLLPRQYSRPGKLCSASHACGPWLPATAREGRLAVPGWRATLGLFIPSAGRVSSFSW